MSTDLGVWVAAFFTLAIFSSLYRDNPVYRFAESLLVGVSAGYYLVQYAYSALFKKLWIPVVQDHDWGLLFGGILGLLVLGRLHRRTEWLARFAIAFYVAAWAGYLIPSALKAQVLEQIAGTWLSPAGSIPLGAAVNELLLLVGVASILVYFYFSREHVGALGVASRLGITFLMLGFGASFGYTIMGRITLLIGRFQFLFDRWLGIGPSSGGV